MVGNSNIVFGTVKDDLGTIESCSSSFNFSSGSNPYNDLSKVLDITSSTWILGAKCSSTVGNEFNSIEWTLPRFLSMESTRVLFYTILRSFSLLPTYFFDAASLMIIGSGKFLIPYWFFKSMSSSTLASI